MAQAKTEYTPETNRRTAIIVMAGALSSAAAAIGLAVAASTPTTCQPVDAVHRMIAAHAAAVAHTDAGSAALAAAGDHVDLRPLEAAVSAEWEAARRLVRCTPSSPEGFAAMAAHMDSERYRIYYRNVLAAC